MDAVIINRFMRKLQWYDFLRARLVCGLWYRVSCTVVDQWYDWLSRYGKQQRIPCSKAACHGCHHTSRHWTPKILKTAPLFMQVYRQGCKKRLTRLRKTRTYYQHRLSGAFDKYEFYKHEVEEAQAACLVAEQDARDLEERHKRRKRRKIDISKLQSKDGE